MTPEPRRFWGETPRDGIFLRKHKQAVLREAKRQARVCPQMSSSSEAMLLEAVKAGIQAVPEARPHAPNIVGLRKLRKWILAEYPLLKDLVYARRFYYIVREERNAFQGQEPVAEELRQVASLCKELGKTPSQLQQMLGGVNLATLMENLGFLAELA